MAAGVYHKIIKSSVCTTHISFQARKGGQAVFKKNNTWFGQRLWKYVAYWNSNTDLSRTFDNTYFTEQYHSSVNWAILEYETVCLSEAQWRLSRASLPSLRLSGCHRLLQLIRNGMFHKKKANKNGLREKFKNGSNSREYLGILLYPCSVFCFLRALSRGLTIGRSSNCAHSSLGIAYQRTANRGMVTGQFRTHLIPQLSWGHWLIYIVYKLQSELKTTKYRILKMNEYQGKAGQLFCYTLNLQCSKAMSVQRK